MKYLLYTSAIAASLFAAAPAVSQTLTTATKPLDAQIHADPSKDSTNTTVYGLTKPGNVGVQFTSDTELSITGGKGYAQISDNTPEDVNGFDNLLVELVGGGSFTEFQFSIEYGSNVFKAPRGAASPTAELSVFYTLLGGGTGTLTYGDLFTHAGTKDFNVFAAADTSFTSLLIQSTLPYSQIKQNDISIAAPQMGAVPEPATWAMMLMGFGGIGFSMRRKSKNDARLQLG